MSNFQDDLITTCAECGMKSAIARHERDEARAKFFREHYQKTRRLSNDPQKCDEAYREAYRLESSQYDRMFV